MTQIARSSSTVHYAARSILLALAVGLPLLSCTSFQERSLRQVSGIVLNSVDDRPVEGAILILQETRHPFVIFPFATDFFQPIAHTVTDKDGRFHFKVCMTSGSFDLHWDRGGNSPGQEGSRTDVWSENDPTDVRVRLYTKPVEREFDYNFFDRLIEREDSSFMRDCF